MQDKVFQTGIIDVGAHSVRLEIFEVCHDGTFTVLESLTRATRLGIDVFSKGFVTPETASSFSAVICDYAARLKEYGITEIHAFATSAVREAMNRDLVIDRVLHDSGIQLQILESAQEAALIHLAMQERINRDFFPASEPILTLIIGSGTLFVLFIRDGKLRFCEEFPLGTDRLYDTSGSSKVTYEQFSEELRSLDIPQRLAESAGFSPSEKIHLITLGAAPRLLTGVSSDDCRLSPEDALKKFAAFRRTTPEGVSPVTGISSDDAAAAAGAAVMIECFLNAFRTISFSCLALSTRDSMLAHVIRERRGDASPFLDDLRSICEAVGRKYGFDIEHARVAAAVSRQIFDALKQDFNFAARDSFLLEISALLHDIGRFVDARDHHIHSGYLILNTQLPGLSREEHLIVSLVARFHRCGVSESDEILVQLSPDARVRVLKLAAILRVADALDCSRTGRFRQVNIHRRSVVLELRPSGVDFHSEILDLEHKSDLFSRVFGIKVRIVESC